MKTKESAYPQACLRPSVAKRRGMISRASSPNNADQRFRAEDLDIRLAGSMDRKGQNNTRWACAAAPIQRLLLDKSIRSRPPAVCGSALGQQLCQFRAKGGRQIVAVECIGDVG